MLDDKDITPQQGMLVLERDKFEIINIGDDIQIKILDIKQSKVSIGILAPKEVKVHRHEVYKRILKNQGEAKDGGSQ